MLPPTIENTAHKEASCVGVWEVTTSEPVRIHASGSKGRGHGVQKTRSMASANGPAGDPPLKISRSDAGATPEKCQLDVGTDIILIFQNASDIKLGAVVTLALRGFC